MCGRFTFDIPPELLAAIFGLRDVPEVTPSYNVAPTQLSPIVRQVGDHNSLELMTWGLVPPWAKDPAIGSQMINARSETVTEKPSFRHAIRYRRCVIPSSGFFEWLREGKNKTPMYIYRKNGSPLGFAGIWEEWQALDGSRLDTFALLTTTANKLVAPIHDRMTKTELITQIAENSNKEGMTKADLADKIHEHLYYLNGSTNKNAMT